MDRPKSLRSAQDVQDWNEWMANEAAEGKLSATVLNGLNKVIAGAIKINMNIPLEYMKLKARSGKNGLGFSIPWIDESLRIEHSK